MNPATVSAYGFDNNDQLYGMAGFHAVDFAGQWLEPARVMANRIWHYHFGRGIVGTPSDFGIMLQPCLTNSVISHRIRNCSTVSRSL